jgi:hypothetical protein
MSKFQSVQIRNGLIIYFVSTCFCMCMSKLNIDNYLIHLNEMKVFGFIS